jgi:hypothetical protein
MFLSRNLKIEGSEGGNRKVKMSHMYKRGERDSCLL